MPKKSFSAEQIVMLFRQIEVLMAQGNPMSMACRDAGRVEMIRPGILDSDACFSLAAFRFRQWRAPARYISTAMIQPKLKPLQKLQ